MTLDDLARVFDENGGEFLKFDRIKRRISRTLRPDLYAFYLLDALVPGENDIVCCAEHDEIWLQIRLEDLSEKASEEQIVDLIRCGVILDEETESLKMFV